MLHIACCNGCPRPLLFTDNYMYYSSPTLFLDLLKHKTYATGTVMSHRKNFPQCLVMKEIDSYHFATSGELVASCWHNRRDVYMLSTAHTSVGVAMKRPKGCWEKQPLPCPTCVMDYNNYTCTYVKVDLTDQHINYYSLTQR